MEYPPFNDEGIRESDESLVDVVGDEGGKRSIGILFFKKWEEEQPDFTEEFLDQLMQMDDEQRIDYGQVLKGGISDMDELSLLKKISNFSQAVNNSLFDVDVLPPFYYLAVPVRKGASAQDITEELEASFHLDSIFFSYPPI